MTAVQYYEECNNQVSVKFVGSKGGHATKALLPKMMTLEEVIFLDNMNLIHFSIQRFSSLSRIKFTTIPSTQIKYFSKPNIKPLSL